MGTAGRLLARLGPLTALVGVGYFVVWAVLAGCLWTVANTLTLQGNTTFSGLTTSGTLNAPTNFSAQAISDGEGRGLVTLLRMLVSRR